MKNNLRDSFLLGLLLCSVLLLGAQSMQANPRDIVGAAHDGGKVFPVYGNPVFWGTPDLTIDYKNPEYRAVIHCQWGCNWAQIEKKDDNGYIVDGYGKFIKVCDLPPEQYWLSPNDDSILIYTFDDNEFYFVMYWDNTFSFYRGLKVRYTIDRGIGMGRDGWPVVYDEMLGSFSSSKGSFEYKPYRNSNCEIYLDMHECSKANSVIIHKNY